MFKGRLYYHHAEYDRTVPTVWDGGDAQTDQIRAAWNEIDWKAFNFDTYTFNDGRKKYDRFAFAVFVYRDLMNNGLCNRSAAEFRRAFKMNVRDLFTYDGARANEINRRIEARLVELFEAAKGEMSNTAHSRMQRAVRAARKAA